MATQLSRKRRVPGVGLEWEEDDFVILDQSHIDAGSVTIPLSWKPVVKTFQGWWQPSGPDGSGKELFEDFESKDLGYFNDAWSTAYPGFGIVAGGEVVQDPIRESKKLGPARPSTLNARRFAVYDADNDTTQWPSGSLSLNFRCRERENQPEEGGTGAPIFAVYYQSDISNDDYLGLHWPHGFTGPPELSFFESSADPDALPQTFDLSAGTMFTDQHLIDFSWTETAAGTDWNLVMRSYDYVEEWVLSGSIPYKISSAVAFGANMATYASTGFSAYDGLVDDLRVTLADDIELHAGVRQKDYTLDIEALTVMFPLGPGPEVGDKIQARYAHRPPLTNGTTLHLRPEVP